MIFMFFTLHFIEFFSPKNSIHQQKLFTRVNANDPMKRNFGNLFY